MSLDKNWLILSRYDLYLFRSKKYIGSSLLIGYSSAVDTYNKKRTRMNDGRSWDNLKIKWYSNYCIRCVLALSYFYKIKPGYKCIFKIPNLWFYVKNNKCRLFIITEMLFKILDILNLGKYNNTKECRYILKMCIDFLWSISISW